MKGYLNSFVNKTYLQLEVLKFNADFAPGDLQQQMLKHPHINLIRSKREVTLQSILHVQYHY